MAIACVESLVASFFSLEFGSKCFEVGIRRAVGYKQQFAWESA